LISGPAYCFDGPSDILSGVDSVVVEV
jgi:hypothetical protein